MHGCVQEELWLLIIPVDLWGTTGSLQDARKDVAAVMVSDQGFCVVREWWNLPCGHVWADRKEAFDRTWRASFLVRLHDEAGITGRLWSVADRQISTTCL